MKKRLFLLIIPALFMVSCNNGGDNSSFHPSTEHISEVGSLDSTENNSENETVSSEEEPVYSSEEIKSEETSSEEIDSGIIYEENCSDNIGWGNLT